jgi:hypothetical protein
MHIITSDLYRRTGSLIELQQDAIGKKLTVRVEVERARRK